ncbi:hypothetical protein RR47_GL002142 [Enterococcus columbae DSM 7374 = ATCC 51263]|nr:hypothetical protein RR47_GL002142 [Enterococcus columbae DSM 7374 = ATCC 51263]
MLLMVILNFILNIFFDITDIIPVIFGYFILRREEKNNTLIINKLLFCLLTRDLIFIVSSTISANIANFDGVKGYSYIFRELILEYIFVVIVIFIYQKFKVNNFFLRYGSKFTAIFMIYIFVMETFIAYTAHKREIFDQFVFGILLFLIIQTLFVTVLFIWMTIKQKEKYEQKVKDKELIYLKKYTDSLEKDQEQSARFRHDYKNLLLSLKERATFHQDLALKEQIESLEHYSQPYLTDKFAYRYLKNVKNEYVKSLLLSKMYEASQQYIHCTFECPNEIQKIPMDIFDFIRVLGILIDNALEAVVGSDEKEVSIAIYQDETQLEFTIINRFDNEAIALEKMTQKGVTTKAGHHGLGLSNIEEINKKNKNMFVNYRVESKQFLAQVVVLF